MDQIKQTNSSDEIIDFDDEYCENQTYQNEQTPDELPGPKFSINQENQVQESPEEGKEPKDNNLEEDNVIYDPMVKELNEIDINNKQAIIDILMNDDLIIKKALETEEAIKEKNKNKYPYIKATLNIKNDSTFEPPEKKSIYAKYNFDMDSKEGNPELVKDMNVAAYLLKGQIAEENQDVAKLLFDDITKTKSNKKILTGKEIGEKIQKALDNKKKSLERIEKEMYDNQKMEATFQPKINHRKNDGTKRNLTAFLKSQKDFLENVEKKKQEKMKTNESNIKQLNAGKPQVNKKSEKIAEKISGTGPAYMRLYNKRISNKEKIKEVEEKIILKEKEAEQKWKEQENELKKNNPYKHIKSKINIHQSNKNKPNDPIGLIQQNRNSNSPPKLSRGKSAINVMKNHNLMNLNTKKKFDYKDIPSHKMLFNKFVSNFDEALISLGHGEDSKNNEANLEELNENQYNELLFKLGMVNTPPENKKQNEENEQENKEKEEKDNSGENKILPEEKKLVIDSFNLIKLGGDKAKIIDIKNFLICILDMHNYNLYQMFKSAHEQELKELFPLSKFKKDEIPDQILTKQNEELISKIDKENKMNNKYFSVSTENKIIFTLDKAPNIKKDFNLFSFNYRNQKKKGKEDKINNLIKEQCPFKPEINQKSNKIYQKYKDKVFALPNDTVTSNSNSQLKKSNMEYIDRILLLDKKRIAETQKIKEEMEKKQIKECTFKPRINNYQANKKGKKQKEREENKNSNELNAVIINDKKIKNVNKKNQSKFDELYEDGKNKLKNKQNKTREEIELEEQINECTFQPNIKGLDPKQIPKTNFNNDIYNEKEYKILYERLKHGRLERMVKDSNNDRYGLNNELKQFVKDSKEFNYIQNQQYFDPEDPFYYNNAELSNMMNNLNSQYEQENIEKSSNSKDNNNISLSQEKNKKELKLENKDNNIKRNEMNNENNIEYINNNLILEKSKKTTEDNNEENEEEKDKNDDIPLLIIDVNIRQGVKKKIYVYEGDTPEALAEKFAKEQNLDIETKNKLQSLIHTHMQKLLTRIEEENLSNSEKSQNVHNQKNN